MIFSSLFFLLVFLPIVITLYFTVCKKNMLAKNILLLLSSLFFYAWGEPKFIIIMLVSILVNYFFGLQISKHELHWRKAYLVVGIGLNLFLLFIFKYMNFVIYNINVFFHTALQQTNIALPIGISFFTFQAISYIIDVYRRNAKVQKNLFYLALYISFFPQLIAGPIVRYSTIEEQINTRNVTICDFSEGIRRFLIGLSKKVILANNFAVIADHAYMMVNTEELTIAFSWLGSIAYTLQIFCDFSAYSDMAIGLGRMFGFRFMENFNYPYISKSISEFWRRWHISLGMWFRDYVYFPLGGSHVTDTYKLLRNLFVVWLLTGVWHGANWTFILWGLFYFILIAIEKILDIPRKWVSTIGKRLYGIFSLFCINIGWILFRADNIKQAVNYIQTMFCFGERTLCDNMFIQYIGEYWVLLLFGIIYSMGFFNLLRKKMSSNNYLNTFVEYLSIIVYSILFIISISYLVMGAYNPFIYFNF